MLYREHNETMRASSNATALSGMLDVYESVLDGETACYCSAPVTSGKRYIDWLKRIGKNFADIDAAHADYHEHHFQEVIAPNRAHAQRIIQKLRTERGQVVIDPTAIPYIEGWTQHDWRSFWQRVIERYVRTAFFIDDWQYSNGCVYEFWVAHKKGIPTLDEKGRALTLEAGITLIEKALAEMRQQGTPASFIESVLPDLAALIAARDSVST